MLKLATRTAVKQCAVSLAIGRATSRIRYHPNTCAALCTATTPVITSSSGSGPRRWRPGNVLWCPPSTKKQHNNKKTFLMSVANNLISAIVPSQEDLLAMARRRHQNPKLKKTGGEAAQWYFRARVDALDSVDGGHVLTRPQKRIYIGLVKQMGRREAEQLMDEMTSKVINKPQILIPSQVKFEEVVKIYLRDYVKNLREITQATRLCVINRHILPKLGSFRMCDIDNLVLQRWVTGLPLAHSTKAACVAKLRMIWKKAKEWGYVQVPCP